MSSDQPRIPIADLSLQARAELRYAAMELTCLTNTQVAQERLDYSSTLFHERLGSILGVPSDDIRDIALLVRIPNGPITNQNGLYLTCKVDSFMFAFATGIKFETNGGGLKIPLKPLIGPLPHEAQEVELLLYFDRARPGGGLSPDMFPQKIRTTDDFATTVVSYISGLTAITDPEMAQDVLRDNLYSNIDLGGIKIAWGDLKLQESDLVQRLEHS